MAAISRREHRSSVIWPGFVDALATLLMVIIFLLLIFVMAQFFLGQALSGRDKALRQLESDLSQLSQVLALSKAENEQLRFGLESMQDQLSASIQARAGLENQLSQLRAEYIDTQSALSALQGTAEADKETIDKQRKELADLSGEVAALRALKAELEKNVTSLSFRATEAEKKQDELKTGLAEQEKIAESARAQLALMNQQMAALRQQLNALNQALDAAEADAAKKDVQITSLGQRLNAALASKVNELTRYRSEFFGRLREVLGNRSDVRIVGDRFVLQSELLFAKGDAALGESGRRELEKLASTLLQITDKMPSDIDWVLRVDGHTDSDPISTARFPSNWELSTARALSVVHALIDAGIPPSRLAATGFGEFYPIAEGPSEAAKSRNRRIEFKFTER